MQIRLAQKNDLPFINEIYNQAVQERTSTAHLNPVGLDQRGKWFSGHPPDRYPVYVSHDHERITGWVSLGPYRADRQALAHVGEVSYYVDRSFRGQGIGSLLLKHAIRTAPSCGITILVAILLDRNPASVALLEKYGFSKWGCMPGIARMGKETADHLYYGLKL